MLWAVGLTCAIAAGEDASGDWRRQLREPSPEYSQMPFWFWNDDLNDDEIRRQMADFRAHGVYGFVIHPRMGLSSDISFMGERWMRHVRTAIEDAARTRMRVCLYDEWMYPSGSAHGEVVRENPAFAAHGLLMTANDVTGPAQAIRPAAVEGLHVATVAARLVNDRTLDGASLRQIGPDETVTLTDGPWRVMTFSCVPSQGRIRGVHEGEDDHQPNAPAAGDLLSPEAMQAFLRVTYQPYEPAFKQHFGRTVIGMFTDEPGILGRAPRRGLKPWTPGFERFFQERRGYSLLASLPALFLDVGEKTAVIRADYERTVDERLNETYYRPLSEWCERQGIALTGHPAGADEIEPLRYFQIPGQDLVWRGIVPGNASALEKPNSTLAKGSSSIARHDRRPRNCNEIYGAYGWRLTMEEMKWLADWMMVRGVDLLYPHAFYYSIRGDRVNERPPDVGPNNAWWPHYRLFADHTARICGLLATSRQVCDVAILGRNHRLPWRAAKWLYQHQVDFNYLEEWRLLEQARMHGGRLRVGAADYRLVIVDQDEPLDRKVSQRLAEYEAGGLRVRYCRGEPGADLIAGLRLDIVAEPPAVDLRCAHQSRPGLDFYYLVNEGEGPIETALRISNVGRAEWFDAWTGRFSPAAVTRADAQGMTLPLRLARRESIVLCVEKGSPPAIHAAEPAPAEPAHIVPLETTWTLLDPAGRVVGGQLGDWLQQSATAGFTGTLRYRTQFTLNAEPEAVYTLDLGRIGDFAVVHLNDQDLGVRFWAPFSWDVTRALRDGANELVVEVTNSLANKYDPKDQVPSGLMGPVRLEQRPQPR